MGYFRRSGRFGLIGVFVVAALTVVIALTLGSNSANPTTAFILIFGVLALFLAILFVLQRQDIDTAAGADVRKAVEGPREIDDPSTMEEAELWAALAVAPITEDAIKARGEAWDIGRRSINTGILVTVLIFLSVPPIYLFGTFVPLLIGGSLIAAIALYSGMRLTAGGGDVDQAYQRAGRAIAPLGLRIAEHPRVVIERKGVAPYRRGAAMRGELLMEGERHGRRVTVRQPTGEGRPLSVTTVTVAVPRFEARAKDGRLRATDGAPAAAVDVLEAVPAADRWKGVTAEGGKEGIVVSRKGYSGQRWLQDLWLAERLADRLT